MRTIKIRGDASISSVPALIPFQGAPGESFAYGEEVLIQIVDNDGCNVGEPEIRSVVKTNDGDEHNSPWFDAFIPAKNKA